MKTRVSISVVMIFLIGFILIVAPTPSTATERAGSTIEVGATVNPFDIPEVSGDAVVTPRSVPMIYRDDVLRLKQRMRVPGYLPNRGMRGAEEDENGADDGSGISVTTNAPTLSTNFAGISYTNWFPPDPILTVGPSHVLVTVTVP